MNIIKLDAIESTNLHLKDLALKNNLESFTTLLAEHQISGRGQLGTVWVSEKGKNLTFSILVKFLNFKINHQFYLSMAVSLAVLKVLNSISGNLFTVKWPNDILADKDKVAGILIENSISGNLIKHAIIGIGLNVNQEIFPKDLTLVTSLKNISGNNIDRDSLLEEIIVSLKYFIDFVERKEFSTLKKMYLSSLYKLNKPSMFIDKSETMFMGKIADISEEGKLMVEIENETIREFNLKEIKFANR